MAKSRFLLLLLMANMSLGFAQSSYFFVQFKDKKCTIPASISLSQKAIQRRQNQHIQLDSSDFSVNLEYVSKLKHFSNLTFLYASKWENGILVQCDKSIAHNIKNELFVKEVRNLGEVRNCDSQKQALMSVSQNEEISYGNSFAQIQNLGADKMHEEGITGKGIYVAVFDGGFRNTDQVTSLKPLFEDKRIKFTYDIVSNLLDVYTKHTHGTNVLSCLAGYAPGNLIGTGYGADFALIISEDVGSERLVEEYNWLRAAEIADSLGVDIISSSLGYYSFDIASENHVLSDLDGKTSIITKAAKMATRKGILVVNSAGNNYGDTQWRNIVFPCDADSVLSVGATNPDGTKASFSAIGPTVDGRVKPDVSALGVGVVINSTGTSFFDASGTSYSAPLVAGLAAGLWQLDSTLTNIELLNAIKQSANLYCAQNNQIGAGIPNYSLAAQLIRDRTQINCELAAGISMYPNPVLDMVTFEFGMESFEIDLDYQLLDISGREMMSGSGGNLGNLNLKLDLRTLKSGVYFLKLDQKIHKIIKL